MILFAFDLETTGLNFINDRPIEVGAVLYSTGQRKCLESDGFLVQSDIPVSKLITELTGITQQAVDKFGWNTGEALEKVLFYLDCCDAVIGHNAKRFDKNMLESWAAREKIDITEKLWIDTYTDLPNARPGTLTHMAADAGFVNLFPHSALADCQTVLKLVESYNFEEVLQRAKSPTIAVRAHQDRSNNDAAKKLKFRWEPQRKIWYKMIKEMDLDELTQSAPFDISVLGKDVFEEIRDL